MALSKPEFRRRLIAALALYGLELKDLGDLLAPYSDIPKHHPARMGREGDTLVPGDATAIVIAKALGLPERWLLEEDWATLIPGSSQQDRPLEMGEAKRAAAAASRATKKAQGKSVGKRTSKAKKRPAQ